MRIPPPRKPIDRQEVLGLRVREGLSAAAIARRLGYTAPSIRRVMRELGVPLRPRRHEADERWGERLRALWRSVRQRCSNPGNPLYPRYGARGFKVCAEWEEFWDFYDWAMASGYRPGLNLEVVGRSRRFSPGSCRWITRQERMQRDGYPGGIRTSWVIEAFGERKSASEWARDARCAVSVEVLRVRLRKGVPPEHAITLPPRSPLPKDGRRVRASSGPRKLLDWEAIVRLHTRAGLAPAEIAARVDANESTIRHGLKDRGAWRRRPAMQHGLRLRKMWEDVRRRCEDESDLSYRHYGARGARLCAGWREFRTFHQWAIASGYEPGLCLTRKGTAQIYSPRNCRWTTRAEASLNARRPTSRMPPRWTVEAFGERNASGKAKRDLCGGFKGDLPGGEAEG